MTCVTQQKIYEFCISLKHHHYLTLQWMSRALSCCHTTSPCRIPSLYQKAEECETTLNNSRSNGNEAIEPVPTGLGVLITHRELTQDITIPEIGQEVLEEPVLEENKIITIFKVIRIGGIGQEVLGEQEQENNVMIFPKITTKVMTPEKIGTTDEETLLITNTADIPELLPPTGSLLEKGLISDLFGLF